MDHHAVIGIETASFTSSTKQDKLDEQHQQEQQQQQQWYHYPSTSTERQHAGAAILKRDNNVLGIVIAGGRNSTAQDLDCSEFYDVATNLWSDIPSRMKASHFGCAAAAIEDTIYVVGGFGAKNRAQQGVPETMLMESWTYGHPEWQTYSCYLQNDFRYARDEPLGRDTRIPVPPRAYCAAVAVPEKNLIVVIGGRDSQSLTAVNSVLAFHTISKRWRRLPPLKTARMGCAAVYVGGQIMVMGGRAASAQWLDSIEVYSFEMDEWTKFGDAATSAQLGRLPSGGCGFCSAAVSSDEKYVFVVGGRNESRRLDQVQCFNVYSQKWSLLTLSAISGNSNNDAFLLPKSVEGCCAVAFGQTLFVIGGCHGPDFTNAPSKECIGWPHVDRLSANRFLYNNNDGGNNSNIINNIHSEDGGGRGASRDRTLLVSTPVADYQSHHRNKQTLLEGSIIHAVAVQVQDDASALTEERPSSPHLPPRQQQNQTVKEASVLQSPQYVDNMTFSKNGRECYYTGYVDSSMQPHGMGKVTFVLNSRRRQQHLQTSVYEGDWWHGAREGRGKYISSQQHVYEGSFHKDRRHGQGTFKYRDGTVYAGWFAKDKKCGRGTMKFPNGARYEGEFRDDLYNGEGKMDLPDGTCYQGFFTKGNFEGFGEFLYNDGRRYRGEFSGGKANGFGTVRNREGVTLFVGQFKDDVPVHNELNRH